MNENMLIAAESCYELDPSPVHEVWLEKLWGEQEKLNQNLIKEPSDK